MNASLGFLSICCYLTESAHLSSSDQEENRNRDDLLPVRVNTFASDFKPISALVVETTWESWSPCWTDRSLLWLARRLETRVVGNKIGSPLRDANSEG